jgi:hypothetical protein
VKSQPQLRELDRSRKMSHAPCWFGALLSPHRGSSIRLVERRRLFAPQVRPRTSPLVALLRASAGGPQAECDPESTTLHKIRDPRVRRLPLVRHHRLRRKHPPRSRSPRSPVSASSWSWDCLRLAYLKNGVRDLSALSWINALLGFDVYELAMLGRLPFWMPPVGLGPTAEIKRLPP